MRKIHLLRSILVTISFFLLNSCSTIFNFPASSSNSTLGEVTPLTQELKNLPKPYDKIVIGVYKFKDQTGQYKPTENGSSWSTAIPQGTTSILLKALEDSKWFRPIERENIGNLLNERQIIRSTRKEYKVEADGKTAIDDQLPPLLYAGILLEGGIVSYDTNVMTGGIGARYFGIGANTQYRQDRITVYLRVVSSMTGEILKTIYTSKNILSTSINGSFFRYIDADRLLESELGITQNEPVSLAVTQAIEKAVYSLIVEGVRDGLWLADKNSAKQYKDLIQKYNTENKENITREIGNKYADKIRSKVSMFGYLNADKTKSDYVNPIFNLGAKGGIKYFINDYTNIEFNASYFKLQNKDIISRNFLATEANLEIIVLPKYRLTPYLYGGFGTMFSSEDPLYKTQFGGGLEFMTKNNVSVRLNSQYDLGFKDNWDGLESGKRKDQAFRIGLGINLYLSKKQPKKILP